METLWTWLIITCRNILETFNFVIYWWPLRWCRWHSVFSPLMQLFRLVLTLTWTVINLVLPLLIFSYKFDYLVFKLHLAYGFSIFFHCIEICHESLLTLAHLDGLSVIAYENLWQFLILRKRRLCIFSWNFRWLWPSSILFESWLFPTRVLLILKSSPHREVCRTFVLMNSESTVSINFNIHFGNAWSWASSHIDRLRLDKKFAQIWLTARRDVLERLSWNFLQKWTLSTGKHQVSGFVLNHFIDQKTLGFSTHILLLRWIHYRSRTSVHMLYETLFI